jgi:uncharacterized protein involved in outer membrane biogenesis
MRPHLPAPLAAALPHVQRHGRTAARWTLRALLAAGVLVVLLVAAVLYILVVGIDVDAGFLRARLATDMGAAIGREVRFEGPATLTLSARPRLRVGGLEIADPGGFRAGTLARLGEARLALDLWQLLRKRLRVDELAGSDVKVRLVRGADGSANWALALGDPAAPPPPAQPATPDQPMAVPPIRLDLARLTLERIAVEYVTGEGRSHWFDLDSARGESTATGPVKLALKGRVEKSYPYSVVLEGAPLAELVSPVHPWPFTVQVDFLGTALALRGSVLGATGEVQFGVGTENLEQVERLLQTRLPKVGVTAMAGRVRFAPGSVALEQFTAIMGRTNAAGELGFDERSGRRRITGRLEVTTLDLRPFLSDGPAPEEDPASLRDTIREISAATFSLKALRDVDVDVALSVDRWLSLPGDVRDARLAVKLERGRLSAPMSASITGVALEGAMDIDAAADPPRFAMRWGTRDSDLGGLADLLLGLPGVQGRLGRLELRVAATGDQGSELVQSLDAALEVDRGRLSYGNVEGGTPVQVDLERFALRLPAGKPLAAELRGTLLGKPVTATLRGGSLAASLEEIGTPLVLDLRSGPVAARLEGRLQEPTADTGPDLRFSLSAPRADLVARWLGLSAGSDAPVALSGRARMTLDAWRLEDFDARVGRTRLAAGLSRTGLRGPAPLVALTLAAEVIDVAELARLAPPPAEKPKSAEPARPVLQIPILPKGVDLTDADVTVRVKQVAGAPLDPRDIAFDGRIREGAMQPSTFSMQVADTPLRGAVSLDLRGETPGAALWLFAENADVGRILRQLSLARDVDAGVDALRIYLQARASLLGELLAQSTLVGNVEGGRVTLRDPNTRAQVRIALATGELRADPGKPVRLDLAGAIDDTPVKLELETAPAAVLVDPARPIAFRFAAEAARTRVALNGSIARPLGDGDIELELDAGGPRFDALDALTRTDLPPWGPWRLSGKLRITRSGYEVPDLRVEVGSSRLEGRGRLDTLARPPRIDVALSSPRIQLDDFRLGEWSPVEKKPAPADEKSPTLEEMKAKAREASNEAQKMLSPAVLRKQDAFLTVKVEQVLSGADRLGSGSLEAKLEKGRATLGPAVVNVPGGSAELSLYYEPTDTEVKVGTRMRVERFDYGVLARRLKPGTDLAGRFSLKVDVDSKARYLADILRYGSGRIDFAVWPENMKSGVIDLWAVNLLVALAPAVDGGNVSKVNCALGRFVLDQGRLAEKTIVMDTSRMRVTGRGGADFTDETLRLRMTPQAKEPQFLSLALPIEVGGTFQKFSISPTTADVLGMVGRLATSIVWVPIQKLTGKRIPADGADVCRADLPD